jgi:hypothetical protein
VWTDGPEASLRLPLPEAGEEAVTVELELNPFVVPGDERRVLDAFLDDRRERLELGGDSAEGFVSLRADLQPGRRLLEVTLLVRNPADPPSHGIEDDRRLGVQLRSVRISPGRDGGR